MLYRLGLLLTLFLARIEAQADPFGRCEALFRAAPGRWESARCFYEVGQGQRSWDLAVRRLEALSERFPDRRWLLLAWAYVEEERDPKNASKRYRLAVAAFEAAGETDGEVRARCAFAEWLSKEGESTGAGEQLSLAVGRAEAVGAHDALAEALVFQARHLRVQNADLYETYQLARRAEALLFPHGDAGRQMLCLELLAGLERDLGRPDRAADRFRRLERLARANGRRSQEGKAQLALGLLLFDELDRAPRSSGRQRVLTQLLLALRTAEEIGDPLLQAGARASLAHLLSPAEQQENLDLCLALARGRSDGFTASCLLSLARFQASTDEAAAERSLAAARAAAERSGDLFLLARFWYDRMNLRWRSGKPEQAVADSLEAVRAVEALRDLQLELADRAGLFSRWLASYDVASGHLLEAFESRGDPEDLNLAFAFTEARRARVLRDLLASPRSAEVPLTRPALERHLAGDEALLSFQIAPRQDLFGFAGGSWLLVSTQRGTRVYPLPETVGRTSLESAVPALLGLIKRRDGGEANLAAALGSQLLAAALTDLPSEVRRLVVVPDGVLHLLPFAALRLELNGAPLAARYQISTASSATLWARWRGQLRRGARAALVLADPLLPEVAEPGPRRQGDGDGPLPGARREGRHVFRRCGKGSVLRVGAEAGEAFLKRQDLSRFGVLHLAAHAVADEASPASSAVLLATDSSGEDGRLEVDEISRLELGGALVAISSCRSAAGALVAGEGVMSLSRAFFAAGSAVVVGSLWPLRDDEASAFFEIFYDRLAGGDSAAAAFSAAQRQRQRDGAPAEAWAGFVLSGDGGWLLPGKAEAATEMWPAVLVGGFLLTLTAALLGRRRHRP